MIDQQGRLFGKFNLLDVAVVLVLSASIGGVALARSGQAGVNKVLKGQALAEVDVLIKGSVADPAIFKPGEKTFVTIRNQPYAALQITNVKVGPKLVAVPAAGGVKAYPDPSDAMGKEFVVTVRQQADLTEDAIVMGGNKVKIGIPIELEGLKYRLRGAIVDVRLVDQPKL